MLICAFNIAPAAATPSRAPAASVDLVVRPVTRDGQYLALDVTLRFVGSRNGTTTLSLPNDWAGEQGLYRYVHDLRAEGATLHDGDSAAARVLRHKSSALVTLSYRVAQPLESVVREKAGNDYRPVIAGSYFHVLGNAFIISPDSVPRTARAKFRLIGLPAAHSFASDLEHHHRSRGLTMNDLEDSVLVGGDFRVLDAGGGVRLAIRGDWPRNDTEWLNSVREIARSERNYWADAAAPFLVTILQIPSVRPGATSIGGTGRSDAFAMFATRNADAATADQVIAHEMMHSWIPYLIGGVPDKDEALAYWLSEGFTDWAAWRALVRGGIWQPEHFLKVFNDTLHKYDSSPVKALRNSDVLQRFWQDPFVQKLPYQRGMLVATRWDSQIYRSTQGRRNFHHVLLRMRDLAKHKRERGSAVALLIRAMRDVANLDIVPDIEKYVDAGEMLPLDTDAFGICAELRTRERAAFDRGFDVEATIAGGNVIQGVAPDGNAYRAGLRDGMKLIKREGGETGNSEIEIRYSVMDGEAARSLAWLPAGSGLVVLREMMPNTEVANEGRAACVKRLGG